MKNIKMIIFGFLLISCSNRMQKNHSLEEVIISIIQLDCIDNTSSIVHLNIWNKSNSVIDFDGDSFIFKGLYDKNRTLIQPSVLYNSAKEVTEELITIQSKKERNIKISFNDLQYFDLKEPEYIIEFEYSNLLNKTKGIVTGIIPIEPIKVPMCKN